MAYRLQYMLLAESVQAIDQGKINILGVFDQIVAPELPTRHHGLVLVALLVAQTEDELGEHQFRIQIMRPNGQQVAETGTQMRIVPEASSWPLATVRIVIGMRGLPLREYGRHMVRLSVDGEPVGEHPLNVTRPDNPTT